MTRMRVVACVLAVLMIAVPWSSALAAQPVLYTITFVASGTADGVPFTDEPLALAGVADTDTVAALRDAAAEIDPATIQKILSALFLAEGVILFALTIIAINRHVKVGGGQAKILAAIILAGVQTLPVVRDGALVTLTIDSVRDNRAELRFHHVPGGL